jgi:hypothetical protein
MRVRISFFICFLLLIVQGLLFAAYDDYDTGRYRVGGPPSYRYYDKTSAASPGPYDEYKAQQDDPNVYWGDRYYGTEEPSSGEEYEVNRGLMDLK